MSHHLVEMRDLSFTYPDGTPALKNISFRITHGEAVGLVGPNGAGKSTLLSHLFGYLFPTTGTVRVGDIPVISSTLPTIRKTVGAVFQEPDDQLFMPTVFDDVAFGPLHTGLPDEEIQKRVANALEIVGVSHLSDRPPYHLSGGEKRSVAIATALAQLPDILVLDEPSANLDPGARQKVITLLKSFTHTRIIATHDLDLVMDVCERVLVLYQGELRADGPSKKILSDQDLLVSCGLQLPLRLQGCPVCSNGSTC